jgi:hypothetical protein
MKNLLKNKKELAVGVLSVLVILVAVIFTTVLSPNEQAASAIGNINTENDMGEINAAGEPEAADVNTTEDGTAAEDPETQTITSPGTTTPSTTRPPVTTTTPPAPIIVEAPLADVEIPSEEVMAILEEFDIQIVEAPPVTQTAPPPGMPEDAQGTDSIGNFFKIEDGQRYVWNSVLGWCPDYGSGTVTVMDVQSDGYSFYIEPDGTVNLGKVVAPNGSIITFEEYQRIRESR